MTKILITGANSYIGMSVENWLCQWPDKYQVDTVDMIDGLWRDKDFSSYDVVFHVAGIAHQKETEENAPLYYAVNRDLAVQTAQKAKNCGVKQFIILSSMSVYGIREGNITADTLPNPTSHYGKAKLEADKQIETMQSSSFNVAILRPPMVYGKGCKGNYVTLSKWARKLPFFPYVYNQRSMIYIDNLAAFVQYIIDEKQSGCFFPQNNAYICTGDMMKLIAAQHNHRIRMVKGFGFFIKMFRTINVVQKVFGNLTYEKSTWQAPVSFEESIAKSES